MHLLTSSLTPSIGIAASVFGLGVLAWWRNRWARGSFLFALIAMVLALWTSVDWFQGMRTSALPSQITVWRVMFYLSACFAPSLALHASAILGARPFRLKTFVTYAVSLALFFLIDSAFLLRASYPAAALGYALLDFGVISAVVFHMGALATVAARLMPASYDESSPRDDRRRMIYGFVLLALFLLAGFFQFVASPLPAGMVVATLALGFFVVSAMAFIRVRLFEIEVTPLEVFLLLLISGATVVVLESDTAAAAILSFVRAAFIGVFGVMAVNAVRREAARRRAVERMNCALVSVDEEKTDFVNMMAHQLRGPLGGIRFSSDMLIRGDYGALPEKARDVIRLIKNGADRLLSLSETALNAARSEAGVFRTERTIVDPTAEIQTLLGEVRPFAVAKGIALEARISDVPERLSIDAEILRNVTFNLVDNAIKYTDEGRVDVEVFLRDGRLTVEVTDTGAGLSHADIEGLFKRFHRTGDGKRQGVGLGLYVVKKLLDAAHGSVAVESPGRGKGSRFTAEIPCGQVDG
ncbi:MAG: HAMP domain-containing sensor histidine kinase [Patescibacteria group bacterium]